MQCSNVQIPKRNEAYQSITFGKRQPLVEELLDEIEVRLEGQTRKFWELQQFDVQRRRISDDLHVHLNQSRSSISHSQTKSLSTKINTNPQFYFSFLLQKKNCSKLNFNASGESEPIISRYCTKKGTNAVEIFGLGGADSGRTLDLFGIVIQNQSINNV